MTNTPVAQPGATLTAFTSSDPVPASTPVPVGGTVGAAISGTVKLPTGGAQAGGPVAACPTGGGACYLVTTAGDGTYRIGPVPDGSYAVTAFPNGNQVLLQSTPATVTVTGTTGVTVPDLTLGAPTPLQDAGMTVVAANGAVESSGSFYLNWSQPFQLQVRSTACASGTQTQLTDLTLTADNLETGVPFTVHEPVTGATVRSTGQVGTSGNPVRLVVVTVPPPMADGVHGGVAIAGHVACRTAAPKLPTVTGLSAGSGTPGGGTVVTVTGSNFGHVTGVRFGTVPAASFTPVSATELQAVSPPGQGAVNVTVTNQVGASKPSTAGRFSYHPPKVTGVSPSEGSPGTRVSIVGSGFTGTTAVRFGTTAATGVTVVSDTALSVTAPPGHGAVAVTVTTPSGTSAASPADQFTYAPPVVAQVTPAQGTHVGGTEVVLEGSGFTGATKVVFGTTASKGSTLDVRSNNELTVKTPAHTTATVVVRVTTPDGTSTATPEPGKNEYTYGGTLSGDPGDPPSIDDLSNDEDGINGGHQLTISGDNFYTITGVTFGGVPATVTSFTVKSIVVTVPPSTVAGKVPVVVTDLKGSSTPATFTYELPEISKVTPGTGNDVGGDIVTVEGCWFTPLAGVGQVTFGIFTAQVTAQTGDCYVTGPASDAERLTVTTPANFQGTTTVIVTVLFGTGTGAGAPSVFNYVDPTITDVTPQLVPATGGVSVYLRGKGFQPKNPVSGTGTVTTVTFGGTPGTVIDVTPTEIIATVPPGPPGATVPVQATVQVTLPNGTTYTVIADPDVKYACPDGSVPPTGGTCTTTTPTPPSPPKTPFTPTTGTSTTGGPFGPAGGYVDPSGTVTGTTAGGTTAPLAGAVATLEASTSATGPFSPVPTGSDVMSPGNRTNPQVTDALGEFAWTTLPGTYEVTASATGCTAGSTGSVQVPPPREGLAVDLRCSSLPARAASTTSLASGATTITAGGAVTFHAKVTAAGGPSPAGSVTFTSGSTTLGSAVVDPATGKAALTVSSLPVGVSTVTATYGGDAGHLPSSASVTETVRPKGSTTPTTPGTGSTGGHGTPTPNAAKGYWEVASDGGIFAFGDAPFYGSMGGKPLNEPVVGIAATPGGNGAASASSASGYWEVASDGGIFAFGDAPFYGSMGGKPLNEPVVGIAATPTGGGYWEVAADGGIFAFGDAPFYGSMGGKPLDSPVVGIAATPTGGGYWEVASDGGIFAFGDAPFYGSMGGKPLNEPVVGIAATPSGHGAVSDGAASGGYWEVASDGGIFAFGDAPFYGSMGGKPLNSPVVGIAATPDGNGAASASSASGGYWEVASDGGIFAFGDAPFYGSMGGRPLNEPVVGMTSG